MTPNARYDLLSATLDVSGPPDWAKTIFGGLLLRHNREKELPVAMTLSLWRGVPVGPDADATLLHEGSGQDGKSVTVHESGSVMWYVRPDLASLRLDTAMRTADLILAENAKLSESFDLSVHAMDAAIAATGQTLVHAACLAGRDGQSFGLVFAPSGTGKTTTTLALAHAGYAMANDDAAVLSANPDENGFLVWGLARDPNVHRKTVEMLPWLAGTADWSKREERAVPLEVLAEHMPISPHVIRPVGAVFSLARGTGSEAEVRALPAAEALARLVSDNVRHSAGGLGARDLAALDCLTELIRKTPAYELLVPEGQAGLVSAAKVFGETLAQATLTPSGSGIG